MKMIVGHTGQLDPAVLDRARELLEGSFDDWADDDWEHALGGMHAIVLDGDAVLAHASLVQRRLVHRGRALRAGYVEGVAVRADVRRAGHGSAVMGALESLAAGAYEINALGATDEGALFYAARGWVRWRGTTWALTPNGRIRTEDADGWLYVLPREELDLDGELTCDWRDGDVW